MTDMNNFDPACPDCKGTGDADSGGTHPWGAPAYIRCHCETTMKLHPTTVMGLEPTEELGRAIMALRYDLIAPVLKGMQAEAKRQAEADYANGRQSLAGDLRTLEGALYSVIDAAEDIAEKCEVFIEAEKAAMSVEFKEPIYVETVGEKIQFDYAARTQRVEAPAVGFVIGGRVDENGKASLVYR